MHSIRSPGKNSIPFIHKSANIGGTKYREKMGGSNIDAACGGCCGARSSLGGNNDGF